MKAVALQSPFTPLSTARRAPLRCVRERILQTVAFEAGGLVVASPLYAVVFGASLDELVVLLGALAAACLIWCPLHNTGLTGSSYVWPAVSPATARTVGGPCMRCRTR